MIEILHSGIYCSIQDQGRIGFAKMGIPISGAMDIVSLDLANSLLKNSAYDAVIEVTFGMAVFRFTTAAVICITGGDFSVKLNDEFLEMQKVHNVSKGSLLSFGKRKYGARTYIAIQGGIQSEWVLKSRSFYKGISSKIRLEKGDNYPFLEQKLPQNSRYSKVKVDKNHFYNSVLECFQGPEYNQLNDFQKQQLQLSFTISEENNRVGYRLNEVIENNLNPILTSAVMPGSVQLTPSGKLIVLMRDCQVTGGYPRILQLSEKAISRLNQKTTREEVRFKIQ